MTVSISRILDDTRAVFAAHPAVFLSLAAVISIPDALAVFVTPVSDPSQPLEPGVAAAGLVLALLGLVLTFVVSGAVTFATFRGVSGGVVDTVEALKAALHHVWALVLIGLMVFAAVFVGILALLVGALVVAVIFSVVIPVRIGEDAPIVQCFRRSFALTSGHRWPIAGLLLITFVAIAVVTLALASTLTGFGAMVGVLTVGKIASIYVSGVGAVIFAMVSAVLYVALVRLSAERPEETLPSA